MDKVTAARVNDALEKINRMMTMVDGCTEDCTQAAYNSGKIIEELAEKLIQNDKKRRTMYLTTMSDCKENVEKEQAMYNYASENLENLRNQEQQMQAQAGELHTAVRSLREKVQTVPLEKRRNEAKLQEEDRRLKNQKLSVDRHLNHVKELIDGASDKVQRHQQLLGVELHAVLDKCIEFRFTCIDEEDPSAEFKVTVANQEGSFGATACVPLVDEFEELKHTLAEDDQLISFLYKIRIAFKRHVQQKGSLSLD